MLYMGQAIINEILRVLRFFVFVAATRNHAAALGTAAHRIEERSSIAGDFAAAFLRHASTKFTAIGSTDTATIARITISNFF